MVALSGGLLATIIRRRNSGVWLEAARQVHGRGLESLRESIRSRVMQTRLEDAQRRRAAHGPLALLSQLPTNKAGPGW